MPTYQSSQTSSETYSIPSAYGEVLLYWQAPEHEPLELGPRSQLVVTILLIAIIAYALYTNSPLMAITFILIGVVGYLSLYREPRMIAFLVTDRGIIAGNEFYEFDSIQSFFIYRDAPFQNILSIRTTGKLVPYVHIPVQPNDIEMLRDTLDNFIPEEKHEPGLIDTLEKLLHI